MKKSLITNNNQAIIEQFGPEFLDYMPDTNTFCKVSCLGKLEYDYIYITNFETDLLSNFAKIFNNNEEEFYILESSYDLNETVLEKINIAFYMSTYSFSKSNNQKSSEAKIYFENNNENIRKSKVIANAITRCRNLVNEPANYLNMETFTKYLTTLATDYNLECEIIDYEALKAMNAGGILAVNQGSKDKARMVVLKHLKGKENEAPYVLVGKGIMFDTGGYNIKSAAGMYDMKSDMGGSALVTSVIAAIAKLDLPINLITLIPITDNLISDNAYLPGDIITMMNGKTVEIHSTDAEGRLILGDALVYADQFKPQLIIDAATLTGNVVTALGEETTGIFGNIQSEINNIMFMTKENDEHIWQLPCNELHQKQIKGEWSDIINVARPAGASTAAAFLQNFVGDNNWIHLDIAGTAWTNNNSDLFKKGGTGSMVRPLIKYFINISKEQV